MATLDGLITPLVETTGDIRTGIQELNISTLAFAITGIPAALAGLVFAYDQLALDSMGGARAGAIFQGATGVAGFATLIAVSARLDGRDSIHIFEIMPSVIGVGLSGVVLAYYLTPPSSLMQPYVQALSRAGIPTGGSA
jgi:hypothetical protein